MDIQFFKRIDNSSLDIVGSNILESVRSLGYNLNEWSIGHVNGNGQTIKKATLGMVYGMVNDLTYLNMYPKSVAGLVCEAPLTKFEQLRIEEINPTEIWVPSKFCLDMFSYSGFKEKLVLVPHGVEKLPVVQNKKRKNKILMIFNSYKRPNSHVQRKGIFEVLQAFQRLSGVKLILRTEKQLYYNKYNLDNVEFIQEKVKDLSELYEEVDAVLCPSSAEGFGLVGLETLCRGVPLISTKTGNDYLTKETSYVHVDLPVTKEKVFNSVVEFYSKFDFYRNRAIEQSKDIYELNSWPNVTQCIKKRIIDLIG